MYNYIEVYRLYEALSIHKVAKVYLLIDILHKTNLTKTQQIVSDVPKFSEQQKFSVILPKPSASSTPIKLICVFFCKFLSGRTFLKHRQTVLPDLPLQVPSSSRTNGIEKTRNKIDKIKQTFIRFRLNDLLRFFVQLRACATTSSCQRVVLDRVPALFGGSDRWSESSHHFFCIRMTTVDPLRQLLVLRSGRSSDRLRIFCGS